MSLNSIKTKLVNATAALSSALVLIGASVGPAVQAASIAV